MQTSYPAKQYMDNLQEAKSLIKSISSSIYFIYLFLNIYASQQNTRRSIQRRSKMIIMLASIDNYFLELFHFTSVF